MAAKFRVDPEAFKPLITVLKSLGQRAATAGSNVIVLTSALGVIALILSNTSPEALPPAVNLYLSGIGVGSIQMLLEQVKSGKLRDRKSINSEAANILSASNIQQALIDPTFVKEFAENFTEISLQLIQQTAKQSEAKLVRELGDGLADANLIQEEIRDSVKQIVNSLIKDTQKRDAQYDELVRRLGGLLQFLQHQSVLSPHPKTRRPIRTIPLVGREDDLEWLRSRAKQGRDCLLTGQPGSGKTFLFQQLVDEYNALFVVGNDRRQLELAILELEPAILLIDDVHVNIPLLEDLKQIRISTNSPFALFVNCWPSKHISVATRLELPQSDVRKLSHCTAPLRLDTKSVLLN